MSNKRRTTRRDFLQLTLGAGVSSYLLGQRRTFATTTFNADAKAELIFTNARIAIQDDRRSFAEAVAISKGTKVESRRPA
jgi:hypothetical protein